MRTDAEIEAAAECLTKIRKSRPAFVEAQSILAAADAVAPPYDADVTKAVLQLKHRIDSRLNNYLSMMKPDYDDSITGFIEAWDIVHKSFGDPLAASPVLSTPANGWRTIESAPKDNSGVLVYCPHTGVNFVATAFWDTVANEWRLAFTGISNPPVKVGAPTHWHPIPAPPSQNRSTT